LIGIKVLFHDKRRIIGKKDIKQGNNYKKELVKDFFKKESRGNPT